MPNPIKCESCKRKVSKNLFCCTHCFTPVLQSPNLMLECRTQQGQTFKFCPCILPQGRRRPLKWPGSPYSIYDKGCRATTCSCGLPVGSSCIQTCQTCKIKFCPWCISNCECYNRQCGTCAREVSECDHRIRRTVALTFSYNEREIFDHLFDEEREEFVDNIIYKINNFLEGEKSKAIVFIARDCDQSIVSSISEKLSIPFLTMNTRKIQFPVKKDFHAHMVASWLACCASICINFMRHKSHIAELVEEKMNFFNDQNWGLERKNFNSQSLK